MLALHKKIIQPLVRLVPSRYASSLMTGILGWIVALVVRVILACFKGSELCSQPLNLLLIFLLGALADATAASAIAFGQALVLSLPSNDFINGRKGHVLTLALSVLCLFVFFFSAVAEILFWLEFESRFNFIAVDYLAYTTEVIANILQSYPVVPIVLATLALASTGTWAASRVIRKLPQDNSTLKRRLACCAAPLLLAIVTAPVSSSLIPACFQNDRYGLELSKNGPISFVQAFFNNQLDYVQFYRTLPLDQVGAILRKELGDNNATFLSDAPLDVRRAITAPKPEKRWNIILVLEESLSASFVGALDAQPGKSLTQQFDKLCSEGVLLQKCFASGTRTVRGIEAVTLAMPPTPGQSIVKRPQNHNLFTMGTVFRQKGYQCTFIYGGNGFFDNMNDFFDDNDYRILDCNADDASPKTFSNAWGNCDEDVFHWALSAADRAFAAHTPFHQFILTTSNHRPYTFPANAIDAPQGHRSSAVKYSDYALGKFIQDAESHPWFDSTLFVILADHCHSTSGRSVLTLSKYHIPALFYNPKLIQPRKISTVCSQIDIAPTIFGMLGWSYVSEFFGQDVLNLNDKAPRAFPGTFQNLGFLNGATGRLTTLLVKKNLTASLWETQMPFKETPAEPDQDDILRSIALYQAASMRFATRMDLSLKNNVPASSPSTKKEKRATEK